jgi:hypothetical protein
MRASYPEVILMEKIKKALRLKPAPKKSMRRKNTH